MEQMVQTFIRINQLVGAPALKTRPALKGRLPIHRNTLWRWVAAGQFPAPIKLSPGVTAWRLSDVEAWEKAQRGQVE
jgi:prophage regulatory protein